MKFFASNKGYTIIELLTVTGILVVISGIITGIIYTTLRGSNKSRTTSEVAQNGNFALSVISNIVVSSRSVEEIGGLVIPDDIQDCTQSPSGQTISLRRNDGGLTTLSCSENTIASNSASLLDTNTVSIDTVDPGACYFVCVQKEDDPYSSPIVEVGFTITDNSSSTFAENQSSAFFTTSVALRNYSP